MVKKTVNKINATVNKIVKTIEKQVKEPAQIIKDCNARLEREPDNAKVIGWREDALSSLNEGIMGLPYLSGTLETLVEELETELTNKPTKSTPKLVNYIQANKRFIAVIDNLYDRKKTLVDDSEAQGFWEKINF